MFLGDDIAVPQVAVFVDGDDELMFFRRMAAELPELLAPRASVFVSVAYDRVDNVTRIFADASWPKPKPLVSRFFIDEEVGYTRFYNPSGLIEFEFA